MVLPPFHASFPHHLSLFMKGPKDLRLGSLFEILVSEPWKMKCLLIHLLSPRRGVEHLELKGKFTIPIFSLPLSLSLAPSVGWQ